jgi:ABC-2 type transport system permease protein
MKFNLLRYLRLYVIEAYYSYRALFSWHRLESYLSVKVVFPIFQLLLFIFMGEFAGLHNAAYIVLGNLLLMPATNGVNGVSLTIGGERNFGTLPYLLGSPAPRAPLFLGRALFHILDGLSTVIIAIPLAALLFHLDLSQANLPLVAFCIVLLAFSTSGFGLILGSVSLWTREGWTITTIFFMMFYIFCGVNFPVAMLPPALRTVSYLLPLTRGIEAARQALAGAGWGAVAPLLGGEALVGLVYGVLGYGLFRLLERQSLKGGQLEAI